MGVDELLFWLNLVVGYVIPLLGTLYSRTCHEKWIFGWMLVLASDYTINPLADQVLPSEWSQVFQICFNSWFSIFFTQTDVTLLNTQGHLPREANGAAQCHRR